MNNNILDLSLCELVNALNAGKVSSVEATEACFDAIKSSDCNNFISLCEKKALKDAQIWDNNRSHGYGGLLDGVPIALKDNIIYGGSHATCASNLLRNYITAPDRDGYVVQKLRVAGSVIIGKTNMDEFAMGSTNENSAFGVVLNAHDRTRVSGGSSGGSANCVAAKQAYAALGTDTGGSIRQPAAYCGVVGLKPTYGTVDSTGTFGFAQSLDQIGTLTRNCDDAQVMFAIISAKDNKSVPNNINEIKFEDADIRGRTVGVATQFLDTDRLSDGVRARFEAALSALEQAGAKIRYVSIPTFRAALPVYSAVSSAEAVKNLVKFDIMKHWRCLQFGCIPPRPNAVEAESDALTRTLQFGAEVKRRLITGGLALIGDNYYEYYEKATKLRTLIKRDYETALSECDVLLSPTAPTIAPHLGEEADPTKPHVSDMYAAPVNLACLPAMSVPFGTSEGMPVGVQIIGRAHAEPDLFRFGKALERIQA